MEEGENTPQPGGVVSLSTKPMKEEEEEEEDQNTTVGNL